MKRQNKSTSVSPSGNTSAHVAEAPSRSNAYWTPLFSSGSRYTTVDHLIGSYHEQALSQARIQFWGSVAAAAAGFGLILWAGLDIRAADAASVIKILPGAVIDGVAYLFFRQAAATRARATELYDRLRQDKQGNESVVLASTIENVELRCAVQAQIALHMAGLQANPIDLDKIIDKAKDRVD